MTVIGDRESDIYEEYQVASFLIRSRVARRETCSTSPTTTLAGKSIVDLTANYSRDKRTAELEIRYAKVEIKAPNDYKGKQKSVKL